MKTNQILIVEDDPWQAKFLNRILSHEGFEATIIPSGETLFQVVETEDFDAVVLDLGLPDEDGIVLARKLRARSSIPIIVVTGREELDDKLASFDVGADDYLTKPVEPKELAARILAVIRRANAGKETTAATYPLGDHTLDLQQHEVMDADGKAVDLTPAEFAVLAILHQAAGRPLSRDELVDAVSTGDGPLSLRAVDILISRIRKKLGKDIVKTISGIGYRIASD
ncbi:MAG: response regulator transcription factor [Rhodospirillaceae bacterium]|nr:response regulator transcription factor [Rhodospirillaceae bacterium]MBT5193467.1 response regulator transcription factor [Rhodospirillaceae bacterium]MBT6426505.1 response regulator transcription factor [Rhodospirillaceae bacterium]